MNAETLLASTVGTLMLDELVADGFADRTCVATLSAAGLYAVVTFAASEASSQKWQSEPGRFSPWETRVGRDSALELARTILDSGATRWWSSPALDRAQLWIAALDARPTSGRRSPVHYGKPPNDIWTSSALDDGTSAWWHLLRKGADSPPPSDTQSVWRLTPSADARVYEIRSPADWATLCEGFPFVVVDGYVGPDWDAVAGEYDGVHLTVEGLITAQCVEVETHYGTAKLDGWDAESTAWLRWCFERVERIGEVEPD